MHLASENNSDSIARHASGGNIRHAAICGCHDQALEWCANSSDLFVLLASTAHLKFASSRLAWFMFADSKLQLDRSASKNPANKKMERLKGWQKQEHGGIRPQLTLGRDSRSAIPTLLL